MLNKKLNCYIYNDFNILYQVYSYNREHTSEINLIAQQIRRFTYQINELYEPILQTKAKIDSRIELLTSLMETLTAINAPETKPMFDLASQLKLDCIQFSNRLQSVFDVTQGIIDQLRSTYEEFSARMPDFWLNYYLDFKIDFFENIPVWITADFWKLIFGVAKSNFIRELPTTGNEWTTFFTNIIVIVIPFILLAFMAYKSLNGNLAQPVEEILKRVIAKSLPWIVLGISVQYASWYEGNRYFIVSALGTFILCYGQIQFAWDMLSLKKENPPQKSPFMVLLTVLIVIILTILLLEISRIFCALWIVFLIGFFLYKPKNAPQNFALSRIMITSLYAVIMISFILLLTTGLIRVSFFLILIYMCFIMGSHQVEACLYVTSLLDDYLPQSGLPALLSGLLLSIILPLILTLALLLPFVWLLAFPSGEYLINSLGNFNFNIGKFSLNTLEVLSMVTIFYLVKSIIEVSSNYIDNTWVKNEEDALFTLVTPVKTVIFFGLWGSFILYVLHSLGFNLTSLAVIAGGLSVGVGLGLQGFIQNTFSGFLLIFGRNIREGDFVEAGTVRGIVEKVGLRATSIRTVNNAIVFIPNSEFINTSFTNWTHNGHKIRCNLIVGVAYGSNLELVKNCILEILKADYRIVQSEQMDIFFADFAASALRKH